MSILKQVFSSLSNDIDINANEAIMISDALLRALSAPWKRMFLFYQQT